MVIQALKQKHLRPYFTNISWLSANEILRKFVALIMGILLARYLGPEQFGKFNFAMAFVLIFSIISDFGLRDLVVRDLVREPDKADEILSTAFILKILGGFSVLGIALVAIRYLRPAEPLIWWLVGIIAAGQTFLAFNIIEYWFQSQVQSKHYLISKGIVFIGTSLLKIVLIFLKAPLIAFAWITAVEVSLQQLSLLVAYGQKRKSIKLFPVSSRMAKILLTNGLPIMFAGFALHIQSYIDQIMLGQIIGDEEVGKYTAAFKLIEAFVLIPSIICISISPAITRAKTKNENTYYDYLLNVYRLLFLLFLLVFIPIFLFAQPIIHILYGNAYQYSGQLLAILAFRLFFVNFGIVRNLLFVVNDGLFRYSLVTSIIGVVVNVVLNYFLIPQYRSIGAIGASLISFSISLVIVDFFYPKARHNFEMMLYAILTPWKLKI